MVITQNRALDYLRYLMMGNIYNPSMDILSLPYLTLKNSCCITCLIR